ncbi:MAG: hypothetical protein U0X86_000521 [Wolbachia endosymbiont of Xenopsylla cheopis]
MINGIQGIGTMSDMVVPNNMDEPPNDTLGNLLNRNDFTKIAVNDNKELLNFLLKNQLITFDKDKLNFIRGYPLASSLLKKDDITIEDLKSKSIKEIQEKIKKLSQEKILKMD